MLRICFYPSVHPINGPRGIGFQVVRPSVCMHGHIEAFSGLPSSSCFHVICAGDCIWVIDARWSRISSLHEIGWEERLPKDLFCLEWDVKPKHWCRAVSAVTRVRWRWSFIVGSDWHAISVEFSAQVRPAAAAQFAITVPWQPTSSTVHYTVTDSSGYVAQPHTHPHPHMAQFTITVPWQPTSSTVHYTVTDSSGYVAQPHTHTHTHMAQFTITVPW